MEEILVTLQRKHENKVADLQTTVDKLLKVGFPTHMGFLFLQIVCRRCVSLLPER